MEVNIHQAKTELSKLIAAMEAGERVIIKRAGKPVARLVPMEDASLSPPEPESLFGCMKGYFQYSEDAFDPLPDDFWEHNT